MSRGAAFLLPLVMAGAAAPAAAQGVAMEGTDRVRARLPVAALVEDYDNDGYHLRVTGGVATVKVTADPVRSRDSFSLPRIRGATNPVATLARAVAAGSGSRYEAVSRVLSWVARHIAYDLDRKEDQRPLAVLTRRSGYCTGVARLTVSLLQSLEIPAREVAGYVVGEGEASGARGYHRWVEVRYDDRGWVFSDPLVSHHYVPATYIRLASERLLPHPESDPGRLLEREDHRRVVDLYPWGPAGVSGRRNDTRQLAAALRVMVSGGPAGMAVLEGQGFRRSRALIRGGSTFVGLEPGVYTLKVLVQGRRPVERQVVFVDRVRRAVYLASTS